MSHGFGSQCLTGREGDKLCFTGKSERSFASLLDGATIMSVAWV